MGQVLYGSATTTEAIRRAIQHSQESLRALSKHYGINQKTIAKWKKGTSIAEVQTAEGKLRRFSFVVLGSCAELFLKRKLSFPVARMWQ